MESKTLMSFKLCQLCTLFTSNLHGMCGMVWHTTSRVNLQVWYDWVKWALILRSPVLEAVVLPLDQQGSIHNTPSETGTGFLGVDHLFGLVVKVSASKAEDTGFESRLRRDFFRVKLYQWLKNWHSSGYPARRLAL